MKKKKVRCKIRYENVAVGVYNYKVFIPVKSGWCNHTLVTCKNCGELFIIDWENPQTKNLNIEKITGSALCPSCNLPLKKHLANYPDTIRISKDQFGSFNNDTFINEDEESEILEFFEIRPPSENV